MFSIGDKARVISKDTLERLFNRNPNRSYTITEDLEFTPEMQKFCDKTVTISKIIKHDGFYYNGYEILEDEGQHFWSNALLRR